MQAEIGHPARSLMLMQTAVQLAELGDARAVRYLDTPEEVSMAQLAMTLTEAGCYEEALAVAHAEVNDPDRTLLATTSALLTAGELDRALGAVRELADPDSRQETALAVAAALAGDGRVDEAVGVAADYGTEALLQALIGWAAQFDRAGRDYAEVVSAATTVAGWNDARWAAIHDALAELRVVYDRRS